MEAKLPPTHYHSVTHSKIMAAMCMLVLDWEKQCQLCSLEMQLQQVLVESLAGSKALQLGIMRCSSFGKHRADTAHLLKVP